MANLFELSAELRKDVGKGASRRLRREANLIPAIIYGGAEAPVQLSFKQNEVNKATANEAFFSHILTIDIAGKKQQAIIKAMQRHPAKSTILHMDFQRVSATEKFSMSVPLHFIGEESAPGVKLQGGMISHLITELEIKCLPANLPEYIEVDVSKLEMGHGIHLKDIKLPKGVELAHAVEDEAHNLLVVSIHAVKEVADQEIGPAEVPVVRDETKSADAAAEKK